MNLFLLSIKNIQAKPLSSLLSILLFGFGVSIIVSILLANTYLKDKISENAKGVDLVIGAKGSPLQIILASVFHIDFPTGNISLKDAHDLSRNRLVASAIPMSLGDSYQGYRIVGSTQAYANLYEATVAKGKWNLDHMGAMVGANVASNLGISLADELESAHGLSEGGEGHGEHPFKVAGILNPTGKVIDDLVIVSIQSVWEVHAGHEEDMHHHGDSVLVLEKLGIEVSEEQFEHEQITTLLVKYRSPMAAVQLPRIVNNTSNLQAASPAYETARLFNIIGVGVDVVNVLGIAIMVLSAVSVFIALLNSLKERKYELAIIRTLGASKFRIFFLILLEGLLLAMMGTAVGLLLAHGGFVLLVVSLGVFSGGEFFLVDQELMIVLSSLGIGIFASVFPAMLTFRTDLSDTLARS